MTRFDAVFANVPTRALVQVTTALQRVKRLRKGDGSLILAVFSAMPRDEWDRDWRERCR